MPAVLTRKFDELARGLANVDKGKVGALHCETNT